jgi:hypothetical protein
VIGPWLHRISIVRVHNSPTDAALVVLQLNKPADRSALLFRPALFSGQTLRFGIFRHTNLRRPNASVLASTVDLTLVIFRGGPVGSLSAFLVGAIAPAGLTLSRTQCLNNHTASAQCLICADGPPLLRRLLSARHPHRVLLRSLKRLCFLDTDAVSSQPRNHRLPDVSGSRKEIAMGRPVNCFNKHRRCPNPQ